MAALPPGKRRRRRHPQRRPAVAWSGRCIAAWSGRAHRPAMASRAQRSVQPPRCGLVWPCAGQRLLTADRSGCVRPAAACSGSIWRAQRAMAGSAVRRGARCAPRAAAWAGQRQRAAGGSAAAANLVRLWLLAAAQPCGASQAAACGCTWADLLRGWLCHFSGSASAAQRSQGRCTVVFLLRPGSTANSLLVV
ncbi:hypothetical protein SLA2020_270470 [Shorea laevis]